MGGRFLCGGVFADVDASATECYNTGKVTVTATKDQDKDLGEVGGVAGAANMLYECYNTGTISTNTKSKVGGVAGNNSGLNEWTVIHCYNTGKVTGKKGSNLVGGIFGSYSNS